MSEGNTASAERASSPSGITSVSPAPQATPESAAARRRIATLEREARAESHPATAALLFHEIGLLWEQVVKHPRHAASAYQQAFKLAPKFLANIRAARRLFAQVNNWGMVAQLIDAESNSTEVRRTKAALLFEKAQLLDQRLGRSEEALATAKLCLESAPEDLTLLVQLEQFFNEKKDYAALAATNERLARTATEDRARAHYLTAAGLLHEDRLGDVPRGAALFREAMALDRTDPQLLAAIKRAAQRDGSLTEELAALAAEAERQGESAAPTLLQIARAHERQGRLEDALAALVQARARAPKDLLVLAELSRLHEAQSQWEPLAEVLKDWADANTDSTERVGLTLQLAALYDERLGRSADAIGCYQRVLALVPGHSGALAGLGRLYHRAQDWTGLLATYDAEAAAADDPAIKAAKQFRAGETLEEKLGQVDEAIARYRASLVSSPGYLPAAKALRRLYEKLGRWSDVLALLESELTEQQDVAQRIAQLNVIAAIHEDKLHAPENAVTTLRRILDLDPNHAGTLRNLARLYERAGMWAELVELNEREATTTNDRRHRASLAQRNAEIFDDQLKDRRRAISAWEQVLSLTPAYLPALRALGRLYGQEGKWESLVQMYRTEADLAASPEHAALLIQKIGELHEQKRGDRDAAIAAYREVLTLAPNHFPALRALARIHRAHGDWEALVEVLRGEASLLSDPTERANTLFQVASLWEDELKNPQAAIDAYREVLRLAPTHLTALQRLERQLTARDEPQALAEALTQLTQSGPAATRQDAFIKLARLYVDRINEPAKAAECCEAALALDPKNLAALRLLERIRAQDPIARVELRNRIAQAMGDGKLAAAIRLAAVDELPAGAGATAVFEELTQAYTADPTDEALGLALERVLRRAGDAAALAHVYEKRRGSATDASELLQLALRLGDLYERELDNPVKALTAYRAALNSAPELAPALLGVVRCCERLGDFALARSTLVSLAASAKDPGTRLEALFDAATIARDREGDLDTAANLLRKALEVDPLHPEVSLALEELLAKKGGDAELAAMHQTRGAAKQQQGDPLNAAREFFTAAKLYADRLKDPDKATSAVDQALMAMPTMPDALELKATLAIDSQSYADAAAALAVRIQQGGDPKALSVQHLRLGGLYHDHLSDPARAVQHLQTVLLVEPASLEALSRLASLHSNARNWTGATYCFKRLIELEGDAKGRAKHTLALAKLVDEGLGDTAQAIGLYQKALELVPLDQGTLDKLLALYERTGAQRDMVSVLEQQSQLATDVGRALSLKLRIGAIQQQLPETSAQAIATYKQVLDIDPSNVAAQAALAELYTRDPSASAFAIEAHRALLRLDPTKLDSWHTLFRLFDAQRQADKVFCIAAVLSFFKAATEVEQVTYAEGKTRLTNELKAQLTAQDLQLLHHPKARSPLLDVLRAVGDQFERLSPPQFEQLGIDRKADKLKKDHAVAKALAVVAQVLGVDEYDVYQSKRGLAFLETSEPLAVCIGQTVPRLSLREQRFFFGRAALLVKDRAAILRKLSSGELADTLGNTVRIHQPGYSGLGRRSDEHSKQLRRAYSRRAIKDLEQPAIAVAAGLPVDSDAFAEGMTLTADRFGLLVAADVGAALTALAREEAPSGSPRLESTDALLAAVISRKDLKEALNFVASDDFFRLRARLGVNLG